MAHQYDVKYITVNEEISEIIDGQKITKNVAVEKAVLLGPEYHRKLLEEPYKGVTGEFLTLIDGDKNDKEKREMEHLTLEQLESTEAYADKTKFLTPSIRKYYNFFQRWLPEYHGHVVDGHENDKNIKIYTKKFKELAEIQYNYYEDGIKELQPNTGFEMVTIAKGVKFYKAITTFCTSLDYEQSSITLDFNSDCIDSNGPAWIGKPTAQLKAKTDATTGVSWMGDPATASYYLKQYYGGFLELELTTPTSLFIHNTKNLYRIKKYVGILIEAIETTFIYGPDYELINSFADKELPKYIPNRLYEALVILSTVKGISFWNLIESFPDKIKKYTVDTDGEMRKPLNIAEILDYRYINPLTDNELNQNLALDYIKSGDNTEIYKLSRNQTNLEAIEILNKNPPFVEINLFLPPGITEGKTITIIMPFELKDFPMVIPEVNQLSNQKWREKIIYKGQTYPKYLYVRYENVHDLKYIRPFRQGKIVYIPSPGYVWDRIFQGVIDEGNMEDVKNFHIRKIDEMQIHKNFSAAQKRCLLTAPNKGNKVAPKLLAGETNIREIMLYIYNNYLKNSDDNITICNDVTLKDNFIKNLLGIDNIPASKRKQLEVIYYDLMNYGNVSYLKNIYALVHNFYDSPAELCEKFTNNRKDVEKYIFDRTKHTYFETKFYKHTIYNTFKVDRVKNPIYGVFTSPINTYKGLLKYEKTFNDFIHRRYGVMGILYPRALRISQPLCYHECVAINPSCLKINTTTEKKLSSTEWGLDMSKLTRVTTPNYCDTDFLHNSLNYVRVRNIKFKYQEHYFRGIDGLTNMGAICAGKNKALRIFSYNVHNFMPINYLHYDGYEEYLIPLNPNENPEIPFGLEDKTRIMKNRANITMMREKNRKYDKNSPYDINYMNKFVEMLLQTDADIICLQEADRNYVVQMFSKNEKLNKAYKYKFYAPNGSNFTNVAVCIIAKVLPQNVSIFFTEIQVNQERRYRCFITIEYECFLITCVHLEQVNNPMYFATPYLIDHFSKTVDQRQRIQISELDVILNAINEYAVRTTPGKQYSNILVGDFNFETYEPQHKYMVEDTTFNFMKHMAEDTTFNFMKHAKPKFNFAEGDNINECPTSINYTNPDRLYYDFKNGEIIKKHKVIPLPFSDHNALMVDIESTCTGYVRKEYVKGSEEYEKVKDTEEYKNTKFKLNLFKRRSGCKAIIRGRLTNEGDYVDGYSAVDIGEFTDIYMAGVDYGFVPIIEDRKGLEKLRFMEKPLKVVVRKENGKLQVSFNNIYRARGLSDVSEEKNINIATVLIALIIFILIIIIYIKIYPRFSNGMAYNTVNNSNHNYCPNSAKHE